MRLIDFDFNLPQNLIAQKPATPRDSARLMALNRKTGIIEHKLFFQLPNFLQKGDLVIFNNSKVIPARLRGTRETGGKIEILLLRQENASTWEALLNKKVLPEKKIFLANNFWAKITKLPTGNKKWLIKFNIEGAHFKKMLNKYGEMPLPPYIKKSEYKDKEVKRQYQTIYAKPTQDKSVAAPTAGLHFTKRLLTKLKKKGIELEYITLHVGLGTFMPVRAQNIKEHKMHPEQVEIKSQVLKKIRQAKKEGRRIISVGTTATRALESLPKNFNANEDYQRWINIFVYPGYNFKFTNGMITNFHLPKSTLLMMVSAFAGSKIIKKAYAEAIINKYKFYSFGDAMLII